MPPRSPFCRAHVEEGQSTVEYLAVSLGLVAVILALAALSGAGKGGLFSRLAIKAVSHAIGGRNPADAFLDVLMF